MSDGANKSGSEATNRALARIGKTLHGKYTLDGLLGEGGMAVVYSATHRNKKRFAVKMLYPEISLYEDMRARFLKEGYVANTVEHHGVVQVLDDDVAEDGGAFLVMELLDGATTGALAEASGGRLSARAVLTIANDVLDVLIAAHEKGVVHRDLKPANLFVTKDGRIKVLDFGIARIREVAKNSESSTTTGMMLGTPAFMPPEQAMAKSNEIDGRTDLWAVGATMFNLLSGRNVHEGENPTLVVIACATQPARSVATVMPELPREVIALIDRATKFEKADRWQSAREMQNAVRETHRAVYGVDPANDVLLDLHRTRVPAIGGSTLVFGQTPSRLKAPMPPTPTTGSRPSNLAITAIPEMSPEEKSSLANPATPATNPTDLSVPMNPPIPANFQAIAQPVARTAAPSTLAPRRAPQKFGWWVVAIPIVFTLLGVGLALRANARTRRADRLAVASANMPPAPKSEASAEKGNDGTPPSASSASAGPVPSVATSAAPESATPSAIVSTPKKNPDKKITTQPSASAASAMSSASAAPKKNCDPPYFIDGSGKHYKPECFP